MIKVVNILKKVVILLVFLLVLPIAFGQGMCVFPDRLSVTGQFGVGTSDPQAKVHIEGTDDCSLITNGNLIAGSILGKSLCIDGDEIMVRNAGVADNLILNAEGGNVGIGTETPEIKLDVFGDMNIRGNDFNANSNIFFREGAGGQSGSLEVATGTGNFFLTKNGGGGFEFRTDPAATTRMAITGNGDIGIGTTTPTAKLDVDGVIKTTGTTAGVQFADRVSGEGFQWWSSGGIARLFDQTASSDRVVVDTAGNVGIGTTTPTKKLDVDGEIHSTGDVCTDAGGGTCLGGASQGLPPGSIIFFNGENCPPGFAPVVAAAGRYIVGLTVGSPVSDVGAVVGNDLNNKENRAVGKHSHSVIDPGHGHTVNTGNNNWQNNNCVSTGANSCNTGLRNINPSVTGITLQNQGTTDGTNAPYIQFLVCEKTP